MAGQERQSQEIFEYHNCHQIYSLVEHQCKRPCILITIFVKVIQCTIRNKYGNVGLKTKKKGMYENIN